MKTRITNFFFASLVMGFALLASCCTSLPCDAGEIVSWSGETMGTRFVIKVFTDKADEESGGESKSIDVSDLRLAVDAELRSVNDQMSTYLKSSEITRFNDSESTDWFRVSPQLAEVVSFAQQVSSKTDGAFDVTVGPLVDAWNFGTTPRSNQIPSEDRIREIRNHVGYQKLHVRMEPPSLKKDAAKLRVDLSAIAKGHGVDRIIDLLGREGYANVFVEIGGEVGTAGSKDGKPWVVGIQLPDSVINHHDMAYPFASESEKRSMATSGDYRNYIEVDGKRYSHSIDPRTGKPIEHRLASVSVVADSCMSADAWATAITVLGPIEGAASAKENDLDAILVERSGDGFLRTGIGGLQQLVDTASAKDTAASSDTTASSDRGKVQSSSASGSSQGLAIAAITFVAFAGILFAMAIGVIISGKSISGSCGGLNGTKNEDGSTKCSLCSNPADACKELREKMNQSRSENA